MKYPALCNREDAWLGVGYYFWAHIDYARQWGADSKGGHYEIYESLVKEEGLLDTVFSQEEYEFFLESVTVTARQLFKAKKRAPTLGQVYKKLQDRFQELGIKGIIYADMPTNKRRRPWAQEQFGDFFFRKRIQFVVYEENRHMVKKFKRMGNEGAA